MKRLILAPIVALLLAAAGGFGAMSVHAKNNGTVWTVAPNGGCNNGQTPPQNCNLYDAKQDVYLSGSNLSPNTTYYAFVTDPSGGTELGGPFTIQTDGNGDFTNVFIGTFSDTPNNGGEYKTELCTSAVFADCKVKSDNFKVNNCGGYSGVGCTNIQTAGVFTTGVANTDLTISGNATSRFKHPKFLTSGVAGVHFKNKHAIIFRVIRLSDVPKLVLKRPGTLYRYRYATAGWKKVKAIVVTGIYAFVPAR